jgi:hypothetical protein
MLSLDRTSPSCLDVTSIANSLRGRPFNKVLSSASIEPSETSLSGMPGSQGEMCDVTSNENPSHGYRNDQISAFMELSQSEYPQHLTDTIVDDTNPTRVGELNSTIEVVPTIEVVHPLQFEQNSSRDIPCEDHGGEHVEGSEEHCNASSQTSHQSNIVPKKRKAPSAPNPRKRMKSLENPLCDVPTSALAIYISQEAKKCEIHGIPAPRETFFNPEIQRHMLALGKEGNVDAFGTMLAYIASSQSIAVLQDVLHSCRNGTNYNILQIRDGLSKAERFKMIQLFDRNIAYFHLVRRYHVLKLFEESGGPKTRSSTGLIVITSQDFVKGRKKAGNPVYNAEAEVTGEMMKEIFPDMTPGMEGYQSKYRAMKQLRRLGQRLYLMQTKFGKGILGLMPDYGLTGESDAGISDKM